MKQIAELECHSAQGDHTFVWKLDWAFIVASREGQETENGVVEGPGASRRTIYMTGGAREESIDRSVRVGSAMRRRSR